MFECGLCRAPLFPLDTEYIACLGPAYAEAALTNHFFLRKAIPPCTLSHSLPSRAGMEETAELQDRARANSCLALESLVLFAHEDQCPSSHASGMVSFGGSEDALTTLCLWLSLKRRTAQTLEMTQPHRLKSRMQSGLGRTQSSSAFSQR